MTRNIFFSVELLAAAVLVFAGCGRTPNASPPATQAADEGNVHGEWWCSEHGVPEDICAQCNVRLADGFKAKGDWCKEHDRPESQCFICHPEKESDFAALFEAKYGKKPPKPTAEGEGGAHAHEVHENKT